MTVQVQQLVQHKKCLVEQKKTITDGFIESGGSTSTISWKLMLPVCLLPIGLPYFFLHSSHF